MSQQQPHDNFIHECEILFGKENAEAASILFAHSSDAYGRWKDYNQLFVRPIDDPKRYYEIMKKSAIRFFSDARLYAQTAMILLICQLTDPKKTLNKYKNLSIRHFNGILSKRRKRNCYPATAENWKR